MRDEPIHLLFATISLIVGIAGTFSFVISPSEAQNEVSDAQNPSQVLQGNASQDVAAVTTLKDIEDTCRQLKLAYKGLFYEVQRPQVIFVGTPLAFGNTVIPSRPDPSGMVTTNQMVPPRKKWVDYFVAQFSTLMPQLGQEMGAFVLPADASQSNSDWQGAQQSLTRAQSYYQQLVADTKGPKYDATAIARDVQGVCDEVDGIERIRKRMEKQVKRDEKSEKKRRRTP